MKKMKWAPTLHFISATLAVLGLLAMIGAWLATSSKNILGFSEGHLYSDATILFLGAIAFGVGTLIHHHTEK